MFHIIKSFSIKLESNLKIFKTLKDIEKLPFTTKDDLRKAYPFGMFAVST